MGHVDLRAQRLQARGVQVQAARADGVAAGDGDVGLAAAGDQRAEHADRGAQRADQVVVGAVADAAPGRRSRRRRRPASSVDVAAEPAQQLGHDRHVEDVRHVGQPGAARRRAARRPSASARCSWRPTTRTSPRRLAPPTTRNRSPPATVATARCRGPSRRSRRVARLAHGQPHAHLHPHRRRRHDATSATSAGRSKTDPRLVAYADVDEANAADRRRASPPATCREDVAAAAAPGPERPVRRRRRPVHPARSEPTSTRRCGSSRAWVDELEADCDRYNERVEKLRSFILPGGTPGRGLPARRPHGRPAGRAQRLGRDRGLRRPAGHRQGRRRGQPADGDVPQPALGPAVHPGPGRQPRAAAGTSCGSRAAAGSSSPSGPRRTSRVARR